MMNKNFEMNEEMMEQVAGGRGIKHRQDTTEFPKPVIQSEGTGVDISEYSLLGWLWDNL